MLAYFQHLAGYNAWANQRVYTAAAQLTQEQVWRDTGLFFGSLGGTLNHILVADRVWMKRFTGEGDHPSTLNAVLHHDLADLRAAREAEDRRIIAYVSSLTPERLERTFTYRKMTALDMITSQLWPDPCACLQSSDAPSRPGAHRPVDPHARRAALPRHDRQSPRARLTAAPISSRT